MDIEQVGKSSSCEGYSGADLASLVREAATEALRESMVKFVDDPTEVTEVSMRHIEIAFEKVRPSVQEKVSSFL